MTTHRWFGYLKQTFSRWNEDKALRLSAALAYYSVFSIAPLLVIVMGIAGLMLGHEAVTGQLQAGIKSYVGEQAAISVQAMVESASKPAHGIVATLVGFLTLLLGASGVFGELKDALNTIWEVKPKASIGILDMLHVKVLNFGMVLVVGFLLLVSLLLTTAIASLNHRLEGALNLPPIVWTGITFITSFGVVTTLFALIFKVLPDAKIQWRDVWIGAVLTALLFEIGKTGLGWYLGRESTANAYGAAASVVLLLLWVYYASCILFFGAEFTRVYAEAGGRHVPPAAHAQPVTVDDRLQQGLSATTSANEDPQPPVSVTAPPSDHPLKLPRTAHKILGPILKYLEGRGMLLSIEAKEALRQIIVLLILTVTCCVVIFAAWLLLATAVVGLLTKFIGWFWVTAVAVTGGIHVLIAAGLTLLIWRHLQKATWFSDTLNELKKDRLWLKK